MAISQIRARLDGQWYDLRYDSASAAWQASLVPTETSFHQDGGTYNITLEVVNETGTTRTADGADFPALLLKVLEKEPPTLTAGSPTPGTYQTTNTPTFVFDAVDTGSGVDISTLSLMVDGEAVLNASSAAITDGYRISYTPASPLPEGVRTVRLSVSDHDGNQAELTAQYIIDTVPPALFVTEPFFRHIFDTETILLSGTTNDATAPPVTVKALQNGVDLGEIPVDASGRFSVTLPLDVGENNTVLTVTDLAGLQTVCELYTIRLITDRTQADAERALVFNERYAALNAEGQAEWSAGMRGAYNHVDLNRVATAMDFLDGMFSERGIESGYTRRAVWLKKDIPLPAQTIAYLSNVEAMRSVLPIPPDTPETPPDLEHFVFGEANDIEKILVNVDTVFPWIEKACVYCGEAFAGEF